MIYVVLAAGLSRRMGFPKAFTPLPGDGSPFRRIADLLRGRDAIAVVPPAHAHDARSIAPAMRVVENSQPQRGMAHSLRLALRSAGAPQDFGVLLGDKPFLSPTTLSIMEGALAEYDVAFPLSSEGVGGHPVLFAARVWERALALPDGDTIRDLRDDPALRRNAVTVGDAGAFADVNTPAQWEAARDA
ncbi:MAG: nucleotidyltransferase family protein [Candidatus Tyrphobacter sp.]